MTDHQPLLPYNRSTTPSSGWSGSDTSRQRAQERDSSGATATLQAQALALANAAGLRGITVKELREATTHHHGSVSGALSVLHKEGALTRLASHELTRNRCSVYVTPPNTNGRDTVQQGRTTCPCPHCPGHQQKRQNTP